MANQAPNVPVQAALPPFLYNEDDIARQDRARHSRQRMEEPRRYPTLFWDGLSHVQITSYSLAELDRRNEIQWSEAPLDIDEQEQHNPNELPRIWELPASDRDLRLFTRHGGPDMTRIAATADAFDTNMVLEEWVYKAHPRFKRQNVHLGQHLEDHGIHLVYFGNEPSNMEEVRDVLRQPPPPNQVHAAYNLSDAVISTYQAFLGPVSEDAHRDFFFGSLSTVLHYPNPEIEVEVLVEYRNLEPITDFTLGGPSPDFVDGNHFRDLPDMMLEEDYLRRLICIDSELGEGSQLILPNFILDEGLPHQHTCLAGAYGARAMHAIKCMIRKVDREIDAVEACLRAYLPVPPHEKLVEADLNPFDDQTALAFSALLWKGSLRLFAHHVAGGEGGKLEVSMTLLREYDLRNPHPEAFRRGMIAYTNLRVYAQTLRDNVIDELRGLCDIWAMIENRDKD